MILKSGRVMIDSMEKAFVRYVRRLRTRRRVRSRRCGRESRAAVEHARDVTNPAAGSE
jgi:hypothetical protein